MEARRKVYVESPDFSKTTCEVFRSGDRDWVEFDFPDGSRLAIGTKDGVTDEVYLVVEDVKWLHHKLGRWYAENKVDLHPWWRVWG